MLEVYVLESFNFLCLSHPPSLPLLPCDFRLLTWYSQGPKMPFCSLAGVRAGVGRHLWVSLPQLKSRISISSVEEGISKRKLSSSESWTVAYLALKYMWPQSKPVLGLCGFSHPSQLLCRNSALKRRRQHLWIELKSCIPFLSWPCLWPDLLLLNLSSIQHFSR